MEELSKIIIVEGKSDKKKIEKIIQESIEIICTNGTIGVNKLDELIDEHQLDFRDVYILADADSAGKKLRKQFMHELPHAQFLYIDKVFREVESAPEHHLALVLVSADIEVDPKYLIK